MKSLIDEAKEIIEMSLSTQIENDAYSLKANGWLKKAKAREIREASDNYDTETSCALCGNDLVCPSCHDH